MAGSFVLDKAANKKFKFNLLAGNHEVILTSELYETKASAEGGVASVRTNAVKDERYQRKVAKNGSPYFVLTATNGQVVGVSEMYSSSSALEKGIASVKANAPSATLIDKTV